jgi:ATP-dependent helicase/nuclease subunit A
VENFRSREAILNFANSFFSMVMREDLGGVAYDKEAELRFGAPEERADLSVAADPSPRVELQLRLKGKANPQDGDEEAAPEHEPILELQESEKEARLVALRLRELKLRQHRIYDKNARTFRPVDWSDMAILLRSPANKAESYAKEFIGLNIPLHVERGGFYESLEISDLVNLLRLLDNPLQDLPLLAVLHSPLVGLTANELAMIRLAAKGPFWTTLRRWHEAQASKAEPQGQKDKSQYRKVSEFLERHARWRRSARQGSLSQCLDTVLLETHYGAWLQTQPRGEQRHANVQRLLGLALQFDQFQRQSLFRFLCFVDAQQLAETEPEVATSSNENAVRLMSIHQSKGLEFPVVVLADAGKAFNLADLRGDIILDEEFGLCPQVKPPQTGRRYPSLPYWLARHRQKRELLGEELRLLYVAMTRARDTLILSGAVTKNKFDKGWTQTESQDSAALFSANSYADWLGFWFSRNCAKGGEWSKQGENALLSWRIHGEEDLTALNLEPLPEDAIAENQPTIGSEAWKTLRQRLTWEYPFRAATGYPAKTSVTVLRRRAAEQMDDLAADFAFRRKRPGLDRKQRGGEEASANKGELLGKAHHVFLQHVSLKQVGGLKELQAQARIMAQSGVMTPQEVALLDFDALAAFWQSELGEKIRAHEGCLRRELAFTARFSPDELAALTGEAPEKALENEFVVLQGVVDLAVLLPEEIWLIDFKTDRIRPKELEAKTRLYEPQLKLYAQALARIYRRPVSQCWLYFLSRQAAVAVSVPPTLVAQTASTG